MAPLFALLLFTGLDQGPITAAEAPNAMDFRLVVDAPEEKVLVDALQVQTNGDGSRNADLYVTVAGEPATYAYVRSRFDCQARTFAVREAAYYDRNLRFLGQTPATYAEGIQSGTVGEDLLAFVCGTSADRQQKPYYGSTVREALGRADPRFR